MRYDADFEVAAEVLEFERASAMGMLVRCHSCQRPGLPVDLGRSPSCRAGYFPWLDSVDVAAGAFLGMQSEQGFRREVVLGLQRRRPKTDRRVRIDRSQADGLGIVDPVGHDL